MKNRFLIVSFLIALTSVLFFKVGKYIGAASPSVDGPIVGRYVMDVAAYTSYGRYGSTFDHPAHTDYYFIVRSSDGSSTAKILVSRDIYEAMKDGQTFKVN